MTQHTPGPWTVDDCPDAYGRDTIRLADGTPNGNIEAQPIATAYSHSALIAAAPIMRDALLGLLDWYDMDEGDLRPLMNAARYALAGVESDGKQREA